MSDSDKMRAEFEAEARVIGLSLFPMKGKGEYWNDETNLSWRVWQAAYAAGQKAEREAVQKEALQQLVDEAQKLDMGY